jgi:hypothetical protein
MGLNDYDKNYLALAAYASIAGDGTSPNAQGCVIARTGAGVYTCTLDADSGITDTQSFTSAQVKGAAFAVATVEETSNLVKTIRTFNQAGAATDTAIEVQVRKSVQN